MKKEKVCTDKRRFIYNHYLKAFRQLYGLSQHQIADYLGISIRTIQAWDQMQNRCPKTVYLALRYWQTTGILDNKNEKQKTLQINDLR